MTVRNDDHGCRIESSYDGSIEDAPSKCDTILPQPDAASLDDDGAELPATD